MLAAPNAPPADSAPLHTNPAASASEPRPPTHPPAAPGASQRAAAGRVATGTAGPRPQARPEGRGLHALAAGAGTTPGAAGGRGDMEEEDDSVSQASGEVQQDPDPFYDEAADEKDAAWADRQRSGRVSDAVLSCPGCFTTLCIDCQRHEKYHQQYRAMFVMNCVVDEQEEGGGGGGGRGGGRFDPAAVGGGSGGRRSKRAKGSAAYRRVRCGLCDTEVGALEVEEELYHFYHVFPSNA